MTVLPPRRALPDALARLTLGALLWSGLALAQEIPEVPKAPEVPEVPGAVTSELGARGPGGRALPWRVVAFEDPAAEGCWTASPSEGARRVLPSGSARLRRSRASPRGGWWG